MKKIIEVSIAIIVLSLFLVGCAKPTPPVNKVPTFSINNQEAVLGETLILDLNAFVIDESLATLNFVLLEGEGEIDELTHTYTYTSTDTEDVGEHQVTIRVIDNAAQPAECTFTINTIIVISGNIEFANNPVIDYNDSIPYLVVKGKTGDDPYENLDDYTFNYFEDTGRYEIRNVPQENLLIQFFFGPSGSDNSTVFTSRLPGGITYTGYFDLTTKPVADYDKCDFGNLEAVYSIHVISPYDNSNRLSQDEIKHFPAGEITFTWEPIPGVSNYRVRFQKFNTAFLDVFPQETIYGTTTTRTFNVLSEGDEFYRILIDARDSQGNNIGYANTIYANGFCVDIRFVIDPAN